MGMVGCYAAVDAATLERLIADPDSIPEFLYPEDGNGEPEPYFDLDKSWHGIHFLLTGRADEGPDPLSLAVSGGEPIGDEVGYGPARYLTPSQVREIAAALGRISASDMRARFDPRAMEDAKVYPQEIWVRDAEEALEYLIENYVPWAAFYRAAAERGDGMIAWLT